MKKTRLMLLVALLLMSVMYASPAFASDGYVEKPGCGKTDGSLVCVKHYVWLRPNYNVSNGYGYRHAVSEYCMAEDGTEFIMIPIMSIAPLATGSIKKAIFRADTLR